MKIKEVESKKLTLEQSQAISCLRIATKKGQISLVKLKETYQKLTGVLNMTYETEVCRTRTERYLHYLLTKGTKEDIRASVWIGNHCVDLFVPRIGLAIEVDGDIHHNEMKMRKDELKEGCLEKLGIMVWHIENTEVGRRAVDIIKVIEHPKTKEKNVETLLNDIYIETIGIHLSQKELFCLIDGGTYDDFFHIGKNISRSPMDQILFLLKTENKLLDKGVSHE